MRELADLPDADLFVDVGFDAVGGHSRHSRDAGLRLAANKWIALTIAGPAPAGKDGRNVSEGAAYDAKRRLIWATDANGQIYVLKLEAASVARKDL